MAVIAIKNAQLAGSIAASKLAGSIPDSKLSQISTAGKVALSALEIDGASEMGAALSDADLFIVDDGANGTEKSMLASRLPTYLFGKVSGNATIASNGSLSLADDCVAAAEIADGAVGTAALADLNVTSGKLANLAVIEGKIGNLAVTTGKIAADAVTQAKIGDDAVGADQLAANAVVFASVNSSAYTTNLASSASSSEFARADAIKAYVDGSIAGLDIKASVVAASTGPLTASDGNASSLTIADGASGFDATANTFTLDGKSLSQGDRVLIKDMVAVGGASNDAKFNGVYTVGALTGSTLVLSRASDFDQDVEFVGAPFFMVEGGTDNGAHGFVCDLTSAPTLGTDPITFYQFSAPGQDSVAGAGIGKSGNVLSLDIDELDPLGGTGVAQGDHFVFSDDGTEKKITFSNLEDAIFANINSASSDIALAAGGALTLADDCVGSAEIADNAVLTAAITDLNVTSGKIANLAVVEGKIGASAVTTAKINDDAVTQAKIANDAVGADELASSAVVTASMVDNAVTAAKLGATIQQEKFTVGDSSTTTFDLTGVTLDASHLSPQVYRNGLALIKSTDSDNDSYQVSQSGGGSGVTRITLGAAAENGDIILVVFIA